MEDDCASGVICLATEAMAVDGEAVERRIEDFAKGEIVVEASKRGEEGKRPAVLVLISSSLTRLRHQIPTSPTGKDMAQLIFHYESRSLPTIPTVGY